MPPRIIGRYAVFDEVAAGGMATVHLGRLLAEAGFSRTVAVKRLHPQLARDPDFVTMFLDEARLASRIRHPNVVSTLDIVSEGDEVLLVMEYVAGESLSRLMKAARPGGVPVPIAVAVMTSVLHGLHAAHEAKTEQGRPLELVHRDVSPQNILVGVDGVARVLDFGVAKAAHRAQTTKEGQLKGKLSYMAPEQLKRDVLDRRCDVYAAAVVLWECITGQKLFEGESEARVVMKMLEEDVPVPSSRVPGLPPSVDAVILKGLARDPSRRYATAREMAIALERSGVASSPTSAIGEWVEALAVDNLASRAHRVAEIERDSDQGIPAAGAPSSGRLVVPAAAGEAFRASLQTAATLPAAMIEPEQAPSSVRYATSATLPGKDVVRPRRTAAFVAGAAMLLVAGTSFVVISKGSGTRAASSPPSHVTVDPPSENGGAAAVAPIVEVPPPPTSTAATVASTSTKPQSSAWPPRPASPPANSAKAAPAAKADRCKPPYIIDAAGIRHIKPECL